MFFTEVDIACFFIVILFGKYKAVHWKFFSAPLYICSGFWLVCFYRLSPKSSRNLAASFSCQSPIGLRRPKKNRRTLGSSIHSRPPIN